MSAFRPHDLPLLEALVQAELGVWLWFPETDQCAVSGNLGALGDAELPDQLAGWLALLHPEDRVRVSLFLAGHDSNPDACFDGDIRLQSTQGRWRSFAANGRWRPAQGALPRHALFTLRDVTRQRANEEHLRKSEKAYRTLVETSPDAILLLNLDGTLQTANQQAQRLFGLDELRDSSETSLRDFLVAGDDPASTELLSALARPEEFTGIVVNRIVPLRNGDGRPFEAEIAFTTVFDDNGAPGGLVLFARDITEKVRAAAELQKHQTQLEALVHERTHALEAAHAALAQILEGSPVPTFVLDADNVVTHWNQACEKIIGTPAKEMVGTRDQWRAFYPEPRPVLADLVMSGSLRAIEDYYGDKFRPSYLIDGAFEAESYFPKSRRWMVFTAAPLKDKLGNIIGAIETMQDITERKLAEQYLLEAKQLAESAARTQAEFLANMSHEIRTPMNAVIGLAHVLLKTELSSKQREQVMRIRGAGKMLLGLINDILDFSKIEAGKLEFEESLFRLDEVLNRVRGLVDLSAQKKGLRFDIAVA
ncbi:MAG TPA: PAS domain S-box protein, partial [Rhodocyclaceae bacterium]|nr:PAS domain S-box protein [Rhodocyclaceae bacterium]